MLSGKTFVSSITTSGNGFEPAFALAQSAQLSKAMSNIARVCLRMWSHAME
jgi:hypothetical protein